MGIDTCGSCVVNSTTTGVSSGWSSGISSVASEASGDASVEMDDPESPSGQLHSTEEEETCEYIAGREAWAAGMHTQHLAQGIEIDIGLIA